MFDQNSGLNISLLNNKSLFEIKPILSAQTEYVLNYLRSKDDNLANYTGLTWNVTSFEKNVLTLDVLFEKPLIYSQGSGLNDVL